MHNAFGDVWLESTKVMEGKEKDSQKKMSLLQGIYDDFKKMWSMKALGYN